MTDFFDAYSINKRVNKKEFELAINQLPVNLLDFALTSGLRHRVYGVRIFGSEDCSTSCCFNAQARRSVWQLLFNIQQFVMAHKRMAAGPLYIKETQYLDKATKVWQSKYSEIEKINVIEEYSFVDNLILSPFIVQPVNIIKKANGLYEAHFSSSKAANPNTVILRDAETFSQYPWEKDLLEYPTQNGYEWVMPIGTALDAPLLDDTREYALQDYEYMFAVIRPKAGVTLENCVVFHPNSQQILPFAKPPEEIIEDGEIKWRFWFYAWTLGKPEFDNDEIDLIDGEFYKLYNILELYERKEVEKLGSILYTENQECDENPAYKQVDNVRFRIREKRIGIITYDYPKSGNTYVLDGNRPYQTTYYYKTNPVLENNLFLNSVEEMRRAIIAKVAATINLESCLCHCDEERKDYLTEMQKVYTNQFGNSLTGSYGINYKYGHRHGDFLFEEMMKNLKSSTKLTII